MKKKNKTKRYIIIEFDGTTTKAYTFRAKPINVANFKNLNWYKGFRRAEAKLHPDDDYDQNEGIRIALERIGFDVSDNPFAAVFKVFGQRLADAVMGVQEGDKDDE